MRLRFTLLTCLVALVGLAPVLGVLAATAATHQGAGDSQRAHRLLVSFPHTMVRGRAAAVRVAERPVRKHRLLKVWYRPAAGGSWRLGGQAYETRRGKARIRYTLPSTGSYVVRLALSRYKVAGKPRVRVRQVYAAVKAVPTTVPVVMAHRGGGSEAPENTFAAFSHAILAGAPAVETDVHQTSDGYLVLMHDSTLRRTTNAEQVLGPTLADRPIWQLTLAQVQQVQVDVGPGAAQPVGLFSDLLGTLQQNPTVRLLAEAKDPGSQPGLYQRMLDAMTAAGLDTSSTGRAAIESFDVDGLHSFATAHPGLNVSPILQKAVNPDYYQWARSITLESPWATAAQIARLHAGGLAVNVWTLDTTSQLAAFADAGADAVITDVPSTALGIYR